MLATFMYEESSFSSSYPRLDGHIKCKNYLWITQYIATNNSRTDPISYILHLLLALSLICSPIENGHVEMRQSTVHSGGVFLLLLR